MTDSKPTRPTSQSETEAQRVVLDRVESGLPWRENALQDVFPCEAVPLLAPDCGASSPRRILAVIRRIDDCPLGYPEGCPYRTLELGPNL